MAGAGELLRVRERRRAVALARHYRDVEGLSVGEIAGRLGRSRPTISSYFYDPDASKAKALKESYRGRCRVCGFPTSAGDRARSPRAVCARCRIVGAHKWTPQRIHEALRAWNAKFGKPASSADLSRSYAREQARLGRRKRLRRLEKGFEGGPWPAASVVRYHCGTVRKANREALARDPQGPSDANSSATASTGPNDKERVRVLARPVSL